MMMGLDPRRWRRRVYLWLTTSTRDRCNRFDDVGTHLQATRRVRNRIQYVNDVFHLAGMGRRYLNTLEGLTLQGNGNGIAWGFVIIPACVAVTFIACITLFCGRNRLAQQQCAQEEWQQRLLEVAQKREAASEELQSVRDHSVEMRAALLPTLEERQWTAQLESNMVYIKEKI